MQLRWTQQTNKTNPIKVKYALLPYGRSDYYVRIDAIEDSHTITMDKRTICLINDSFPPIIDGVANAVLNYARIIEANHGHSVVVTPNVPGYTDVFDFPVIRYPSIDTRKLLGYVAGYPFSPEAAHAVQTEGADLIHSHCPISLTLLARQIAEAQKLPLVLTWHTKYDIDIANAIKSKRLQEGALKALLNNVNSCDEIWTVSEGAGENLRSIGYEGEYIVMPNGVDLPRERLSESLVEEVTGEYDLPHGVPCFLFIGRLMWYKGLRIILDALAELKNHDIDFRMIIVGGGGDEAEVKEYTEKLGLGSKVFFTGLLSERKHLRAWYQKADLFLFPSTFDTNGLVVREAAASDTAAVIIEGSCAAEGVADGRNGFMIKENAASLAAKLKELTDKPDAVKSVGRNAGDELYLSWEDAVANAYKRYEVVIDKYKSGGYAARDPLKGSWMQSQGELMQILGDIGAARKDFKASIETAKNELDMSMRSLKNRAMTDIITLQHEAKEGVDSVLSDVGDYLERYL